MNSVLKTLVVAIGKDSTGAMKARSDLQRLLKKYPNEVPTALIGIVREKLKKNGLGIILAIQLSATMIGLLLSIIPIPGLAIIGEAVAVAANMGTDLLVAVGPEQIIALLKNGSQQALEAFTKSMVPLIEGISGAFCCNSSGSKKNMEKFGKIMEHLIELENIDNKEEAKSKIEAYIKEIQGVMSKPVPGVDMTALDKLIKKYQAAKDKEKGKTTDVKPKSGGKRRKTSKSRKEKEEEGNVFADLKKYNSSSKRTSELKKRITKSDIVCDEANKYIKRGKFSDNKSWMKPKEIEKEGSGTWSWLDWKNSQKIGLISTCKFISIFICFTPFSVFSSAFFSFSFSPFTCFTTFSSTFGLDICGLPFLLVFCRLIFFN